MENNNKSISFSCEESLTACIDSMLFDSDTMIACVICENKDMGMKVEMDLMVRGEVNVTFKGKTYRKPSQFPADLISLIKTDRNWPSDPDVCVTNNNWFEYIFTVNEDWSDGEMCEEDLTAMTEAGLRAKMVEICERVSLDYTG